jgi:hypothetical protein
MNWFQQLCFDLLCNCFRSGLLNEADFIESCGHLNVSREQVTDTIYDVRAEDGELVG